MVYSSLFLAMSALNACTLNMHDDDEIINISNDYYSNNSLGDNIKPDETKEKIDFKYSIGNKQLGYVSTPYEMQLISNTQDENGESIYLCYSPKDTSVDNQMIVEILSPISILKDYDKEDANKSKNKEYLLDLFLNQNYPAANGNGTVYQKLKTGSISSIEGRYYYLINAQPDQNRLKDEYKSQDLYNCISFGSYNAKYFINVYIKDTSLPVNKFDIKSNDNDYEKVINTFRAK